MRTGNYKKIELTKGQRFGMLTYQGEAGRRYLPSGQYNRMVTVQCDCGNFKDIRVMHLVRMRVKSCGCITPPHGLSGTPIYNTWRGMKNRCSSDKYIDHHRYKDRGITVCPEWANYFSAFYAWATDNGYHDGLTIDRIDNSKGYSPDNCRFVTPTENVNNRDVTFMIDYNGVRRSLSLVLSEQGKKNHYSVIRARIVRGWNAQRAIDTPIRKGNYKRRTDGVLS